MINKSRLSKLIITQRDLQIFNICLDMKFCDASSLNTLVFKSSSKHLRVPRLRLKKLALNGYLKVESNILSSSRILYIGTNQSYKVVEANSQIRPCRPIIKLSPVTIQHDLGVIKSRVLLETQRRARNWISERRIKSQIISYSGDLRLDFMPDAIFTSFQGLACAFEFENKSKTTKQLEEKFTKLDFIMRKKTPPFVACLIVARNETLKNKIFNIVNKFSNRFIVESFCELKSKQGTRYDKKHEAT